MLSTSIILLIVMNGQMRDGLLQELVCQIKVGVSRSTARAILGQVLNIVNCGSQTHIKVTVCDKIPNLLTQESINSLKFVRIISKISK